jgi:hypothetical protein
MFVDSKLSNSNLLLEANQAINKTMIEWIAII